MKKRYILLTATAVVILLGVFVLPVLFKDDIRALVDRKIEENINATVYFDEEQFGLSLLGNFPNLTLEMGNLGIVGQEEFVGDTLAHIDFLAVELDLKSVVFGDQVQVLGVNLSKPRFLIKVLPNGKANYDIAIETPEEQAASEPSTLSIGINSWKVTDGHLIYEDQSLPFKLELQEVEHQGSGDFTLDIFDMDTYTEAKKMYVTYDGIEYLSGVKLEGDVKLGMDLPKGEYTFKENDVHLNDFGLGFDGTLLYPDENLDVNVTFASKENTFKSLLSLIPTLYAKDFDKLETAGSVMFEGYAKGRYNDTSMPGVNISFSVADGEFHYPDLPDRVHDVNASVEIEAPESPDYEELSVDISRFELYMGNNPIKGSMSLKGLSQYQLTADIDAQVDLAEFSKIYPVEGLDMKGLFTLGLQANGVYDEAKKRMPQVAAQMKLDNGYIKSADYPIPVEKLTVRANAESKTGQLQDFKMKLQEASLMMDGKPLKATGTLSNLDDPTYDLDLNGEIDLGIIEKVYPIEGMHLAGHVVAQVSTKGKMSAIEAEKYEQLPTRGSLSIDNLEYKDQDLPQGIKIEHTKLRFTPKDIYLDEFKGALGESNLQMQGRLFNYLAYALKDNETLLGALEIQSPRFNANEWMVDDSGEATEEGEYGVIALPKNINFKMGVQAEEVLYDKFEMKNVNGTVHLRDGILDMSKLNFNLYGGEFSMSGVYDPRDLKNPLFDMGFGISQLPLVDAYQQFASVQRMAPVLESMTGLLSTRLKLTGKLGQDLMPIPASLSGLVELELENAAFNSEGTVIQKAQSLSGLSKLKEAGIQNFTTALTIDNGAINIEPENFQLAGYQAQLGGKASVDGNLDFNLRLDLPGNELPSSLSGVSTALSGSDTLPLNFTIRGSYTRPLVALDTDAIKQMAKNKIKGKVDEKKEELKDKAQDKAKDLLKDKVGGILGGKDSTVADSTAADSTAADSTAADSTAANSKSTGSAAVDSTKKEVKEKLEDLKKKFPWKKGND